MKSVCPNDCVHLSSARDYMIFEGRASEQAVAYFNFFSSLTERNKVEMELADGSKMVSRQKDSVSFGLVITTVILGTVHIILIITNFLLCLGCDDQRISTQISEKICYLIDR